MYLEVKGGGWIQMDYKESTYMYITWADSFPTAHIQFPPVEYSTCTLCNQPWALGSTQFIPDLLTFLVWLFCLYRGLYGGLHWGCQGFVCVYTCILDWVPVWDVECTIPTYISTYIQIYNDPYCIPYCCPASCLSDREICCAEQSRVGPNHTAYHSRPVGVYLDRKALLYTARTSFRWMGWNRVCM